MSEPHLPAVGSHGESVQPGTSTYPAGPVVATLNK